MVSNHCTYLTVMFCTYGHMDRFKYHGYIYTYMIQIITHLFRDNENVHVHEMEGFKLPPFLLAKVQHYIRSLQSKQSHDRGCYRV